MTSPQSTPPEGKPAGRAIVWIVAALLVLAGIYLYFRFGRDPSTVIGLLA